MNLHVAIRVFVLTSTKSNRLHHCADVDVDVLGNKNCMRTQS